MKFHATVFQIMALNSLIIPLLVALVTKWNAHPAVKQIVLIVLSAIGGFVATMIAGTDYGVQATLTLIATQVITSTAMFFSLDKIVYLPVAGKTANVGIGPSNSRSDIPEAA